MSMRSTDGHLSKLHLMSCHMQPGFTHAECWRYTWPCSLLCRGRNGWFHTSKECFSTIHRPRFSSQMRKRWQWPQWLSDHFPEAVPRKGMLHKKGCKCEEAAMFKWDMFKSNLMATRLQPSRGHRGNTERNRLATYCHRLPHGANFILHVWFHAFSIHLRTVYQPCYQFQYISVL